ncbi:MAG: hypothetical protein WA803_20820 [Steroidobacteraceae bacterium]
MNSLPQIEVNAQRRDLEKRVRTFIAAVTPPIYAESLLRWNHAICPVIMGPPPDQSARILARVSQIAIAAGVAIQPKPCTTNFFIAAWAYPEPMLTAWAKRDHLLFGRTSQKTVDAFINTPRPVRVWYNTVTAAPEATATFAEIASNAADALDAVHGYSLLYFDEVQSFASVIVVVDTKRAAGVRLDQLSDYIAVVGLSKINLDADFGGAPTILSIFTPAAGSAAEPAPAGITGWDQNYLKSLYVTRQNSRRQRSEIADMMVH